MSVVQKTSQDNCQLDNMNTNTEYYKTLIELLINTYNDTTSIAHGNLQSMQSLLNKLTLVDILGKSIFPQTMIKYRKCLQDH